MTRNDLRHLPLVFVDDLDRPELADHDHHHLIRALRVRPGSTIALADGVGRWRPATLGTGLRPDELGAVVESSGRGVELTVGFAPVKGDRSELVIQKLTELGVDRIIPVITERTVVRWDADRSARNRDRHRRVAREAAMQSRNLRLPAIEPVTPLAEVLDAYPDAALAEPAAPLPGGDGMGATPTVVVVGPEGGFSPAELVERRLLGLPGNILRTETAAIVAGTLLVLAHSTAERG